jgi:hypothetical protein
VVTTKDGTMLTCIPHVFSSVLAPQQCRWLLIDSLGSQYAGPAVSDDPSIGPLADRVSEWWEARKELLHTQMTPA